MWRDVYGDVARWGATHRHMKRIIRRLLVGIRYDSALDVGCGPGDNLEMLSRDRRFPSRSSCVLGIPVLLSADTGIAELCRPEDGAAVFDSPLQPGFQ